MCTIVRHPPGAQTEAVTRGRKLMEGVGQHLEAGETVLCMVDGAYEVDAAQRDAVRNGVVLATDRRVLFVALKAFEGHVVESFAYPDIGSFEQSRGMMGGSISFTAAGSRVTVKWIPPGSAFTKFCALVRRHAGEAAVATG
jgi:PH (Pleckstrin Homology) domain-containing protein